MRFAPAFSQRMSTVTAGRAEIRSPFAEFWRRCRRKYDQTTPDYNALLEGPSWQHLAGIDTYGRDVFSRMMWGGRILLTVGFLSVVVGVCLGLISGFFGGWLDGLLMRIVDVMLAFPGILPAIAVVALLGPGIVNVIYAIAIAAVPVFARLVRGTTVALKQTLYVQVSRSIGVSRTKLMLHHILPGTMPAVIVYASLRMGTSILTAAALSFIGLGAQPRSPEWGAMQSDGRSYLGVADHVTIFPGMAILITVLAFNLLGDGLRDALYKKLR
jgi:glutathione transport system permease protein